MLQMSWVWSYCIRVPNRKIVSLVEEDVDNDLEQELPSNEEVENEDEITFGD